MTLVHGGGLLCRAGALPGHKRACPAATQAAQAGRATLVGGGGPDIAIWSVLPAGQPVGVYGNTAIVTPPSAESLDPHAFPPSHFQWPDREDSPGLGLRSLRSLHLNEAQQRVPTGHCRMAHISRL